jgi:peptidoglycan hydrolase-like protein with peptidoglycan-binding domain
MNRLTTIAAVTTGTALLSISVLAQTTTPSSTSGSTSVGQGTNSPEQPTGSVPAATQPGGMLQGGDAAKTPATTSTDSTKTKPMSHHTAGTTSGMKGERVRSVQDALKSKGYDPGPVDGVLGSRTQAALKDFQKAEQLPVSGRQDPQTLARLGVQ